MSEPTLDELKKDKTGKYRDTMISLHAYVVGTKEELKRRDEKLAQFKSEMWGATICLTEEDDHAMICRYHRLPFIEFDGYRELVSSSYRQKQKEWNIMRAAKPKYVFGENHCWSHKKGSYTKIFYMETKLYDLHTFQVDAIEIVINVHTENKKNITDIILECMAENDSREWTIPSIWTCGPIAHCVSIPSFKQSDHVDEDIEKLKPLVKNYLDLSLLKRGDVIHFYDYSTYRNDGKVMWDGKQIIPFEYESDEYGHVPSSMLINEFGTSLYFSEVITHNCIVYFDTTGYKIVGEYVIRGEKRTLFVIKIQNKNNEVWFLVSGKYDTHKACRDNVATQKEYDYMEHVDDLEYDFPFTRMLYPRVKWSQGIEHEDDSDKPYDGLDKKLVESTLDDVFLKV